MKRSREELERLRDFCNQSYNSAYGSRLHVSTEKQFDPKHFNLGYCYKFVEEKTKIPIYQIVCATLGFPETDFRVIMHEYGHIYLGHLDGIQEELDQRLCDVLFNNRTGIVEHLNKTLGISNADALLDRIFDDPAVNHSLHNIAMDMEVNSSVLSPEDIAEMEADIQSTYPKFSDQLDKYLADHEDIPEDVKESLEDAVRKLDNQVKVKLILPEEYELSPGVPFPSNLTYPDYLMLIVQHLDQFIKMLASMKLNRDPKKITKQDLQDLMNQYAKGRDMNGKSDAYKRGYQDALRDLATNQIGKGKQDFQQQQGQGRNGGNPQPGQGQNPGDGDADYGQRGQEKPRQFQGGQPGNRSGSGSDHGQQGDGEGNQPGQGQSKSGNNQEQEDYNQGYNDAIQDALSGKSGAEAGGGSPLGDLLRDVLGVGDEGGDGGQAIEMGPWTEKTDHRTERHGLRETDHDSDSRKRADEARRTGVIKAGGGNGFSSRGTGNISRAVDSEVDAVDMALNEVVRNMRKRVVKVSTKKDLLRNYNRGIVRSVISPAVMRKVTISTEQKIVYLIDVSGSMDTLLVDRILKAIRKNMRHLSAGLKYDIIAWDTSLQNHIKDIDSRKRVPRIGCGGGTYMAGGISYFKDNYGQEATLIVISDFEDQLEEWDKITRTMNNYLIYGFNYGSNRWSREVKITNMRVKNFNQR